MALTDGIPTVCSDGHFRIRFVSLAPNLAASSASSVAANVAMLRRRRSEHSNIKRRCDRADDRASLSRPVGQGKRAKELIVERIPHGMKEEAKHGVEENGRTRDVLLHDLHMPMGRQPPKLRFM